MQPFEKTLVFKLLPRKYILLPVSAHAEKVLEIHSESYLFTKRNKKRYNFVSFLVCVVGTYSKGYFLPINLLVV